MFCTDESPIESAAMYTCASFSLRQISLVLIHPSYSLDLILHHFSRHLSTINSIPFSIWAIGFANEDGLLKGWHLLGMIYMDLLPPVQAISGQV